MKLRKGRIYFREELAGVIFEDEEGIHFQYDKTYMENKNASPISLTMPLQQKPFSSKTMIPFFDGLIPEGWLLDIAEKNWKINPKDRMGLLLVFCKDCIGAVSIIPEEENE